MVPSLFLTTLRTMVEWRFLFRYNQFTSSTGIKISVPLNNNCVVEVTKGMLTFVLSMCGFACSPRFSPYSQFIFLSLQAYKNYAERNPTIVNKKSLPALTKYTPDQMYFIGWAQVSRCVVIVQTDIMMEYSHTHSFGVVSTLERDFVKQLCLIIHLANSGMHRCNKDLHHL